MKEGKKLFKKNTPLKIVLTIFITEIIILMGLGIALQINITNIHKEISTEEITNLNQVDIEIEELSKRLDGILIISSLIFVGIAVGLSVYMSKVIVYPLNKYLKSKDEQKSTEQIEMGKIILHTTEGIVVFNRDGSIALINPAAKKLLKIGPEDNSFEDIFHKYDKNINMEKIIYLDNWTSTTQKVNVEDVTLDVLFSPFRDKKDIPAGVIAFIPDTIEHEKLNNMRKEFVADVSHELKTPITSIMGYADTLLEGEYDTETQKEFLGVIATEARRMARLVTDLLELSRIDSNKKKVKKESFDLGKMVKECQSKLAIEIKKKNHQVENFVTADVPPVFADKDDIERVVLNILTNSIKYTPDGGLIKIYVGFVYNDAYIKIIDNGIGISEEDLNRIFERFYRVDKARSRENGGTGLGLSIAKEILDKNGGSIDMKSEAGKGTEVVIKVPTKG
jgi:two-component system sensor histidine kinase VicK